MKMYKNPFKYKYIWDEEKKMYDIQFTTFEEQQRMADAKALLKEARVAYNKMYAYCVANRVSITSYLEQNEGLAEYIQENAIAAQKVAEGLVKYDIDKYMLCYE